MQNEFSLDLRVARRECGLTQADCAHLLGVDRTRITALENGRRCPTVHELCKFSLIFGRSFEGLFGGICWDVRDELRARLETIPQKPTGSASTFNRHLTLEQLARRLSSPEARGDHD